MNKENEAKIDAIIYKRLNAPELLEKNIPYNLWSKDSLIDYINFLSDQLWN